MELGMHFPGATGQVTAPQPGLLRAEDAGQF